MKQTIIITALPNGFYTDPLTAETSLILSVKCSFQLAADEPSTVLAQTFPDIAPSRAAIQTVELHGVLDNAEGLRRDVFNLLDKYDNVSSQVPCFTDHKLSTDDCVYLPDPQARFATVAGLPGIDGSYIVIPLQDASKAFPAPWPFRIEVVSGEDGYNWNEKSRILSVSLSAGHQVKIQVSCSFDSEESLNIMGMWNWITEAAHPAHAAAMLKPALGGRHWALTPWREITLVHAVQRPVKPAAIVNLQVERSIGSPEVLLKGQAMLDSASTAKTDVVATWDDRVDLIGRSGTEWSHHSGTVTSFSINGHTNDNTEFSKIRHTFKDTRHRMVTYTLKALSRYREFFEAEYKQSGLDFSIEGTQGFRINIPSTARPQSPEVDMIVPLFNWSDMQHDDGISRKRSGGALRIYLDRPWYSSGEGELLGVVVATGDGTAPASGVDNTLPEHLAQYVTRWGIDPIWQSSAAIQTPTLHQFVNADSRAASVNLHELRTPVSAGSGKIWCAAVAAYNVSFDESLLRWYADVTIDAGDSYYPFVKLALVRYQPSSLDGVEVSKVTVADFIQLTPERIARITEDPLDSTSATVTISGVAPLGSDHFTGTTTVIIRPEIAHPDQPGCYLPFNSSDTECTPIVISQSTTVWKGSTAFPFPIHSRNCRVVIEEYESLMSDNGLVKRLVYADVLYLPADL